MKIIRLALFALATLTAYGCRCGPQVDKNHPELLASTAALALDACPSKDDMGRTVDGVFPGQQVLTITNGGSAPASLTFSFDGPGKDAFSLDPASTPTTLAAQASADITVLFKPVAATAQAARLLIDDGDATTTEPLVVDLSGVVINRPAQPTFEARRQYSDGSGFVTDMNEVCNFGSAQGNCTLTFPSTFVSETRTLKFKFVNKGCPALKISSMEIVRRFESDADLAFYLEDPVVPPTSAAPLSLNPSDGTSEIDVTIRFSPQADPNDDTQRWGLLKLKTNDPDQPDIELTLNGTADKPSLNVNPTFCDVTANTQGCGGVQNKATFAVSNGGTGAITVSSVTFKSNGMASGSGDGRFTVTRSVVGKTIAAGDQELFEVSHNDMPLYVVDSITVAATAAGGGNMPAGTAVLTIAGGKRPCLFTEPDLYLDFNDPNAATATKPVKIKNRNDASCGDLIINSVSIAPNPFFSLAMPIAANTRVAAGGEVDAMVQFKKPISGGKQAGELVIATNDPAYSPKRVVMRSDTPLDELPTAVLTGCPPNVACPAMGSTGQLSVRLSQLSPKTITLSGKSSVDPGNPVQPGITQYRFQRISRPTNDMSSSLPNNGVSTMSDTATLTLDPTAIGTYKIYLWVYDTAGQASPVPAQLDIIVGQ